MPCEMKFNPRTLIEFVKENNCLNILNSEVFDHDLFRLTNKLFHWFDFDTKLLFLDFFKQLTDKKEGQENLNNHAKFMMQLYK